MATKLKKAYKSNEHDENPTVSCGSSVTDTLEMASALLCQVLAALVVVTSARAQHGYSYSTFRGPVSGAITTVQVPKVVALPYQAAGAATVDYVAKPDYRFAYGVEDPQTGNKQNHEESRDGDIVRGQYTVLEPDGSTRIVTYTADPRNGFQATVRYTTPGQHQN